MTTIQYRFPWTEQNTNYLTQWWPHFGTEELAKLLDLTESQVKGKVDKLHLNLLPKTQRLCIGCKTNHQSSRTYGWYCRECALLRRKETRRNQTKPRKQWIQDLLRTLKYRSIENSDLDAEYLMRLWDRQNGQCIYTLIPLREPIFYGRGRAYEAASIDRIDPTRGYIKNNVVWCCWGCNIAKLNFSIDDFLLKSRLIVDHSNGLQDRLKLVRDTLND